MYCEQKFKYVFNQPALPNTVYLFIREPSFDNDSDEYMSDSNDDDSEAEQTQYRRAFIEL